jgi:hypothetical protein
MEIQLTPAEMMLAAVAGVMRRLNNLTRRRTPGHGAGYANAWQKDVEGALAEMAVAKALRLYWNGAIASGPLPADVGAFQVRSTPHEQGHLLLHDTDADGDRFLLLIGRDGRYRLAGWITGAQGKQDRFWREPEKGRACYCVPQEALLPLETLGEA